jgi:hypothetical protein
MPPVILCRRRAHLAAFWVVASVAVLLSTGAFALALHSPLPLLLGLGACTMAVAPGLFWSPWFDLGVRAWNRSVRIVLARLRAVATRLCFYTVFPLVGRAGSMLELEALTAVGEGGRKSQWRNRRATTSPGPAPYIQAAPGWLADLLAHARQTGNWWLLALAPFLLTLMLIGEELEEATPPTSTYTLY